MNKDRKPSRTIQRVKFLSTISTERLIVERLSEKNVRFLSFQTSDGSAGFGLRDEAAVLDLRQPGLDEGRNSLIAFLQLPAPEQHERIAAARRRHALLEAGDLTLMPVVPRPGKFICLGLNYADHAKEGGFALPEYPTIFLRSTTSLVAAGAPIVRPLCSATLDYEAELAVIIGRRCRHVEESAALACVAGYSIFNDASVREYQRRTTQWTSGKNFDATGAFGPELVTPDEVPPGAAGLRVQTRLNGKILQNGNTRDMIFGVARTIALLSQTMTLEVGDVIAMGTPPGVGHARNPPLWMRDGDVCEVEIEGLGILRNPVRDETRDGVQAVA